MSSLEEFGRYLLLKKLGEDPLGEGFRAGRIGGEGVEQVVLLRIFNGRTINGRHLWQTIQGRGAVQEALKSPNIGNGVDLGEVRGVPYAAYDYISGKSLANLLIQASNENSPIAVDHALLIAERLALALSMASETRLDGERIVHGFVVPHLVMISNEGETRLLGFEVAPGLRDLAASGAFGSELTRYLAPEVLAGGDAPADRADDVYSLGVILFELLTCAPLPKPGTDGYDALIDAAQIPQEATALPAEVAALLKKSLAPRAQRIPDALSWHKAVSKLLVDGGYSATTFNLAFFMHNLFRTEIERESQEIEAERTIEIPPTVLAAGVAAASPAAAAAGSAPAGAPARPGGGEDTAARQRGYGVDRAAGGGKKGLWAGLTAALVVAALAAGGYYYYFLRDQGGTAPATEPAAAPPPVDAAAAAPPPLVEPAPATPPAPAGPTPEEIQAQLSKMIDARSAEMEAKLKAQYDERIKALQQQLQATEEASTRREAEMRDQERKAAERAAVPTEEVPAESAAKQAAPAPAGGAQQAAKAPEPVAPAPGATDAGAAPAKQAATEPAAGATVRPSPPVQAPAPAAPRVRVGDLVTYGAGVKPPELIRMPNPTFPTMAKTLNKTAIVDVRVLVDEKGEVQQVEVTGPRAGYGFDQAAMEAARRANYRPATKDGVRVKMWTVVKLKFE
jgi:TonB family protein